MLSIRSLAIVALSILGASAQAQQAYAPAPQAPFWSFNPYFPQAQMWAAPMPLPMQPMRQPMPQPIPFPTPFWLWPIMPQWPAQSPPPAALEPAATAAPAAVELSTQIPAEPTPLSPSSAPPATADSVATPDALAAPPLATIDTTALPEPAMPPVELGPGDSASASSIETILPTASTSLVPPVEALEPVPVTLAPPVASTVVKSRTATKKSTRKIRKLCWKDGRLDVCP